MSIDSISSRRDWLRTCGMGGGMLALQQLLAQDVRADNPLAPKPPHFAPTAKRVIWLFMHGGPSQVDTFDPKPALKKYDGKKPPDSMPNLKLQFTEVRNQKLMASRFNFTKCGASGIEISDGFKHMQHHADDLAVIRSCHHEVFNHTPGIWLMNTGHDRMERYSFP